MPMRPLCLLLPFVLGTSGAVAQTIPELLRAARIVSGAMQPDAERAASARFFDPQGGQFDLIKGSEPEPLFHLRNVPRDRPPFEASMVGGTA